MCSCEMSAEHRRLHRRGRDAVDEHARRGDVLADRLRHADHRGLGGRVGGRHRVALLAGDRGQVDDAAVAARDHARERGAVGVEDAVGVDRHHALPLRVVDIDRAQRCARDAGRADEHVEAAQLALDARDGGVDLGRARDVAGDAERAAELVRGRPHAGGVEIEDRRRGRRPPGCAVRSPAPMPLAPPVIRAMRPSKSVLVIGSVYSSRPPAPALLPAAARGDSLRAWSAS